MPLDYKTKPHQEIDHSSDLPLDTTILVYQPALARRRLRFLPYTASTSAVSASL